MKRRSNRKVMLSLVGLVKPLAGFMALAILLGLLGHLCATAVTVLGAFAILRAVGLGGAVPLTGLFVLAVLCAVLRGGLHYGEQACNHFIAFKLLALIRQRVFRALRRLCPAKLEGRNRGNLINIITSDTELLEVFYAHTISPIAIAGLYTVVLCLFIGSYHWALGLLALAAYGLVGVAVPLAASRLSGDAGLRFRTQSGRLSGFVLDSLRGLPEILQYGAGGARRGEMDRRTDQLAGVEAEQKRMVGRSTAVTNGVVLALDLLMLGASVALFRAGGVGFDGVLVPTVALMSSFGPAIALANLGTTLQNTFAAGNRVLDILEEEPVAGEITGCPPVAGELTGAALEEVSFAYGEEQILSRVSLEVPAHTVVGLVGRSGSGKSTLLKLLMRFWRVEQGRVSVSGRSVEEINTADLRAMESYVTQDTHLFHDSIANNLRIAKLDATQEELEAACRKASVHDFIMGLPRGYDTPVGELGDTLSGGERQRLGLARAFLHDAPLMLLDEPTSNLDSLNEAVILRSLGREGAGRTVVLVSHRASTMCVAQQVYQVENGRLS